MAQEEIKKEEETKKTQIIVENGGLEFVTPDGRLLAALRSTPEGVTFRLFNADGKLSAQIDADALGGVVSAGSAQSKAWASMTATEDGGQVDVSNAAGDSVARMNALRGGGVFQVANNHKQARAYMGVIEDGGTIVVNNSAGELVGSLGAHNGDGGLLIHDRNGARVFAVPVWKYTDTHPDASLDGSPDNANPAPADPDPANEPTKE